MWEKLAQQMPLLAFFGRVRLALGWGVRRFDNNNTFSNPRNLAKRKTPFETPKTPPFETPRTPPLLWIDCLDATAAAGMDSVFQCRIRGGRAGRGGSQGGPTQGTGAAILTCSTKCSCKSVYSRASCARAALIAILERQH